VYLFDVSEQVKLQLTQANLPTENIDKVFQGSIVLPVVVTGEGGVLNPTAPKFQRAPFLLATPKMTTVPANGYPVTIFSHGFRSTRNTALPLINALAAAGQATVAIDTVYHGDRSTCAGITAAAGLSDGSAPIDTPDKACSTGSRCDVDPASASFGRCISDAPLPCNPSSPATGDFACSPTGQMRCLPTSATDATAGVCEGGTFRTNSSGTPFISGWNMLNLTNLFATRDNFRQHTIEHAQLERVLSAAGIDTQLEAQGAGKIDETQINYIGQSLGGTLGPLYTSASPAVRHAMFNAPAGNLTGVLMTSPAFAQAFTGFLAALAAQGLNQGTPAFDQFLVLGKTILDPADPINYIYAVENGPATPANREAFIQYIENDQVLPNPLTEALIATANRTEAKKQLLSFKFAPTEAQLPAAQRHGFLLNFSNPAVTTQAQTQAIQFISTGALP